MPKLSAIAVQKRNLPGRYTDLNGLILQVKCNRNGDVRKSWLVRYSFAGKRREMGIGSFPSLSLAEARDTAIDIKRMTREGLDPIRSRKKEKEERILEQSARINFQKCAEDYIEAYEASWKNAKHRQQWRNTLSSYAYPVIGHVDVNDISLDDVMAVIEPLWTTKPETASRVRGRIERILSWAIVRGLRTQPNPAIWKGQLEILLPKHSSIRKVRHHPALDWKELPEFMGRLRQRSAISARALELTILTASRSLEVRGATWAEIDWEREVWTVPADRMKMKKAHRVPLSSQTLAILKDRQACANCDKEALIFSNVDSNVRLSDSVYRALFARLDITGITTHGFRSTFRDWVGEATEFPRELAEQSLAHLVGDATERAYRRGDALERRRDLMQAWADYCTSSS